MARRLVIPFALAFALVAGACGASPSVSRAPGSSEATPGTSGRPLPSFEIHGTSLEAAAEHDEQVWADGMRASGATELLGPKLYAWLDERRHAFVDAVLAKGGIQAAGLVASTDRNFGARTQTALGGGGMTLMMTGLFLGEFTINALPNAEGDAGFSLPHSETHETEVDGHKATVQMSISLDFHYAGSKLEGAVDITIATTVVDENGNTIGTVTVKTRATVDMEVCPDIDGGLNAHFTTENDVTITGAITGGGASYHLATSGVATGQVGEDALLHGLHVTGESGLRVSGAGQRPVDAAVRMDFRSTLGTPGVVSSATFDAANFSEDVTRVDNTTTSDDLTKLDVEVVATGIIIATLMFEAAQGKWRNGFCVRIEASEQTRDVEPDEVIPFTAKVFHNFDGSELDKPIVATFDGVKSATPLDTPQDPPASIEFTAGPNPGDVGKVSLKTTSNRGIGTLDLTFTVVQLVLEVEVESSIRVTVSSGLAANATATARGRIHPDHDKTTNIWSGMGTLQSKTTSGSLGCDSVTITGNATGPGKVDQSYDWFVRELTARPGSNKPDLWMDSGPNNETPDHGTVKYCTGLNLDVDKLNTWENSFFIAHNKDFGAKGFHVADWDTLGVPEAWKTGGLIAETTWVDNCTGPRAAPPPPGLPAGAPPIIACSGKTTFRVWAVIGTP